MVLTMDIQKAVFVMGTSKKSALQCFCGYEKAANRAA
jgi:hypothetical protein